MSGAPRPCGAKHPQFPSVSCQIVTNPHLGRHIAVLCIQSRGGGPMREEYLYWWETELLEAIKRRTNCENSHLS